MGACIVGWLSEAESDSACSRGRDGTDLARKRCEPLPSLCRDQKHVAHRAEPKLGRADVGVQLDGHVCLHRHVNELG